MNIVAVVFGRYEQDKGFTWGEKPYFYLNMIEATTGTVALVHNGSDFGVVKVVRVVNPLEHPEAVEKVTKPILAAVLYDHDVIKEAERKLADFRKATAEHRVNSRINEALGIDRPTRPTIAHQQDIQPTPRFSTGAKRVLAEDTRPFADDKKAETGRKDLDDEIPF